MPAPKHALVYNRVVADEAGDGVTTGGEGGGEQSGASAVPFRLDPISLRDELQSASFGCANGCDHVGDVGRQMSGAQKQHFADRD